MKSSESLSIFLVDDDQLFTTTLKDQVSKMFKFKTTIQTFSTGEECLKHFDKAPNIVILDYFLNSNSINAMNGLEVLKKILIKSPETKVIMLSGQDKMEIAVNLIKYGAHDYIIKNENVFLRTKLVIMNAANAISVSKELKSYKFAVRVAVGIITGVILGCIGVQLFFPNIFMKG